MNNEINPKGKLEDTLKLININTLKHAREITADRIVDKNLCSMGFWTADFPVYTLEKEKAILYLADRENNLLLKNMSEGIRQISEQDNYFLKSSDIEPIISSPSTLRIDLSKLRLQGLSDWKRYTKDRFTAQYIPLVDETDNSPYILINTTKYDASEKLTMTERKLAEAIYGREEAFDKVMKQFSNFGISTVAIGLLNPIYIKEKLTQRSVKGFGRCTFLDTFKNYSNIDLGATNIDYNEAYVRGEKNK